LVASAAETLKGSATVAVVSIKHTAKRSAKDFFAICFICFFPFLKFAEETVGIDKVMISYFINFVNLFYIFYLNKINIFIIFRKISQMKNPSSKAFYFHAQR
jgi:hypothetical protein